MSQEQPTQDEQLFLHLVTTFTQSAWIAMGKVKNPVTDKVERQLDQASFYIDLLDMMQKRMRGNLSDWEEQFIIHSVSELKLNFIEEKKKPEPEAEASQPESAKSEPKSEKEKPKKKTKAKSKAGKTKKT